MYSNYRLEVIDPLLGNKMPSTVQASRAGSSGSAVAAVVCICHGWALHDVMVPSPLVP
jgi:hypothetical protein